MTDLDYEDPRKVAWFQSNTSIGTPPIQPHVAPPALSVTTTIETNQDYTLQLRAQYRAMRPLVSAS